MAAAKISKAFYGYRYLFYSGLLIKLLSLGFFGTHFLRDLFVPFIDFGVQNITENPWRHFSPEFFPYGSVQYFLFLIPKWLGHLIFGQQALGDTFLSRALFKLPILVCDTLLFLVLIRMNRPKASTIAWTYWLNPVLFCINYVIVQVDVTSCFFVFLTLLYMVNGRSALAGILYAAATLCKFHVIAVAPFLLVYFWNHHYAKDALKHILIFLACYVPVVLIGFIPHIDAAIIRYATLASPQALQLLALKLPVQDGTHLYIGLVAIFCYLSRLCLSTRISRLGLIFGVGSVFCLLVLLTNPSPGWFYWYIPFLALLTTYNLTIVAPIVHLTSIACLGNWAITYSGAPTPELAKELLFCLQQTTVALAFGLFYWLFVVGGCPITQRLKPLRIGIAGDSASGKDRFSSLLRDLFSTQQSTVVAGDNYHRWERGHPMWKELTHLDPRANYLGSLSKHLDMVSTGEVAEQPHYDHSTGQFTAPQAILPKRTMIFQGLHTLYYKDFRDSLDLKIFLGPDSKLQIDWKFERDGRERGYTKEQIANSIASRKEDAEKYILPQRQYADLVICYSYAEANSSALVLNINGPCNTLFSRLAEAFLSCENIQVESVIKEFKLNQLELKFSGSVSQRDIARIASEHLANLRQLTRSWHPPIWREGLEGISQLFVLAALQENRGKV